MVLCLFSWPVHANFALPQGTAFYLERDGRAVSLQFRRIDGARATSYMGGDFGWLIGGYKCELVELLSGPEGDQRAFRRIYRIEDRTPFVGGTLDFFRFTRVEVAFELDSADVLKDEYQFEQLKQWAVSMLDEFVDHYRLLTSEPDVPRPRLAEAPVVDIYVASEYRFDRHAVEARFRPVEPELNWTNPVKIGHSKKDLSDEKLATLAEALSRGSPAPLHKRLLLDAREQSHLYWQHELAIVLIGTAFEVFLQQRILTVCQARGIAGFPRGKGVKARVVPTPELVAKGNIQRDLLPLAGSLATIDLKTGQEYVRWRDLAYEPRNAIVHRGVRRMTEVNARDAFESTAAFIHHIEHNLR